MTSINVRSTTDGSISGSSTLPAVFSTPLRSDLVQFVFKNMNKNHRQPYGVMYRAGMNPSADSWGPGRAVARLPRVSARGTRRSGEGAKANMARGGGMYAPTHVWRKWHRKTPQTMRRYAVSSAVAASAIPSLVQARGHSIANLTESPLVVDDAIESASNTKAGISMLTAIGAYDDIIRAKDSKNIRAGRGKMRNRRHTQRRGPLVVYNRDNGIVNALRNLPGIEVCRVDRLNLLQLAPGGHLGRFVVWTNGAFNRLNEIFGTITTESQQKSGFSIPRPIISNADISRIIESNEIQAVVKKAEKKTRHPRRKINPLKNRDAMHVLNPYSKVERAARKAMEAANTQRNKARKANRKNKGAFNAMITFDDISINLND